MDLIYVIAELYEVPTSVVNRVMGGRGNFPENTRRNNCYEHYTLSLRPPQTPMLLL